MPYELWQPADPRRIAVISAALNSYRHEMIMANARGIPIQQQHGQLDDNVPAYNSRLLSQQLFLAGTNSSYNEVPGQNHWWDTVMTTPQLVDFYCSQTKSKEIIPRTLDDFEFVVGDPGDMGSKGGIKVVLLDDPGQYGRVRVKGNVITTSNVLCLEFDPKTFRVSELSIDGWNISLEQQSSKTQTAGLMAFSKKDSKWVPGTLLESNSASLQRHGRQLGFLTAILRTKGAFIIRHLSTNMTSRIALQISRNLHQYFQADTRLVSSTSWSATTNGTGNVITIATGDNLPPSEHPDFSIQPSSAGVKLLDSKQSGHLYSGSGTSLGAIFLRPLGGERLELVVWGSDGAGLTQAARLVPMVTGVGQPDFVILGESAKWEGVEGALAMGFLDWEWRVTPASVVS